MARGGTSPQGVFSRMRSSRPSLLQALARKPLLQFAVFSLFVVVMVSIMTAGIDLRGAGYRNLVAGEIAPYDIKAGRDFAFTETDLSGSKEQRARAAEQVLPVFDWQEGLAEDLRDRIAEAFGGMRKAMAEAIRTRIAEEDPERLAALEANTPAAAMPQALIELLDPAQRVAMARDLRADTFDARLGAALRNETFETFARAGFSAELENALAGTVGEVMANIIVPSSRVIEAHRDRGVFLRRLDDDRLLIEYYVSDLDDRFVPVEQVPRLVEDSVGRRLGRASESNRAAAIRSAAGVLIRPNTSFNEEQTARKREAAREAVDDLVIREDFRKGQVIVDKGHVITERHLRILEEMREEQEYLTRTQTFAGVALFSLLLLVTLYIFGRRNVRKFRPEIRDLVFMGSTMILMLLIVRLGVGLSHAVAEQLQWVPAQAWYYVIPVAAAGMLIRLVLNSEHAIIFTLLFGVLVGVMADSSLLFAAYAIIGGLVGAGSVRQVKNRMALAWSGLLVGAVNLAVILAYRLIAGELLEVETLVYAALGVAGGIGSGIVASFALPLFETVFGYTTDIKLLELANLNHPALRDLILRAPGSYHHSMMVGSLCEAAAERIGCNPLLSRVGAYYHDIGKAKNPQYFAENQKVGENPHDRLKPNMSALVIKAHVKDGLEMARQHRLPTVIQDFITQHHGTSLIAYFYHKAKQMEDPDIPEVDEKDYRYPGPRPQSRETAICMLADGIEAASRAMPDPTPARLKGLVQKMINQAFTDGQLDECDLTLKDLNQIAQAFTRILTGIYHHRPEYPDRKPEKAEETRSQETRRKPRSTTPQKRITTKINGRKERPTPAPEAPVDSEGEGLSASSSDVWEISAEQVQDIEEEVHAHRHPRGRSGDDASEDSEPSEDAADEGRQPLPRLGSE